MHSPRARRWISCSGSFIVTVKSVRQASWPRNKSHRLDGLQLVIKVEFKVQFHVRIPVFIGAIHPCVASTFTAIPIWRGVNCFFREFQA